MVLRKNREIFGEFTRDRRASLPVPALLLASWRQLENTLLTLGMEVIYAATNMVVKSNTYAGYFGYPFEKRAGGSSASSLMAICLLERWSGKEPESIIGGALFLNVYPK